MILSPLLLIQIASFSLRVVKIPDSILKYVLSDLICIEKLLYINFLNNSEESSLRSHYAFPVKLAFIASKAAKHYLFS